MSAATAPRNTGARRSEHTLAEEIPSERRAMNPAAFRDFAEEDCIPPGGITPLNTAPWQRGTAEEYNRMTEPGPSGHAPPDGSGATAPVRVRQRAPFMWANIYAVRAMRAAIPEGGAGGASLRSVYFALAELAADARDGDHDGFNTTRQGIAAAAAVSLRTATTCLQRLEELGLLEVVRRTDPTGRDLASVYVLTDPPAPGVQPLHTTRQSQSGGATVAHRGATSDTAAAPPTRAHRTEAKKEESPQLPPTPRAPLAGQTGEEEVLSSVGMTYREEALKVGCPKCAAEAATPCQGRRGPRESAHHERHAAAIAGGAPVLTADRQGATRQRKPRSGPREDGTNPIALGTNPRALGTNPRAAAARGPEPEAPTADLEAAWLKIRAELHAAAPDSWALYLEPLTLRGTRGGELVLTAPYGTAGWVRDRFARLITAAVHHHISTDATVTVWEGAKAA